jgi:hypothetical protein
MVPAVARGQALEVSGDYLGMQDRKFGLSDEWRPYLEYEPLGSECNKGRANERKVLKACD